MERHRGLYRLLTLASSLLVLSLLLLEFFRPAQSSGSNLTLLACLSLFSTALQLLRYPEQAISLLTFLPAIPLALAAQWQADAAQSARALVATAIAFQGRAWLAAFAGRRERDRIKLAAHLEDQQPSQATVFVDNDIESEVQLGALHEGHLFRIAPGEAIPADGVVTFGSSFVNEALLEGQPEDLRMKGMGSLLYAGSRNKNGTLLVRATTVGARTFVVRLATRIRKGFELTSYKVVLLDGGITLAALLLLVFSGPLPALRAFLVTSSVGSFAALAAFELALARISARHRWLWSPGGLRRLNSCGILVTPSAGVLNEGRPRLVAVECSNDSRLSEDAVLGLIGPLARKLESPAAFAVLLELRARNIPLQQSDFFEPRHDGGLAFVSGEEIRWITPDSSRAGPLPLGPLGPLDTFVREHENAGDELCLLERQGTIQAALAFRDTPVKNAAAAVENLRSSGFPVLLVSSLPRRCIARMKTELGLEHAQGESGPQETENLVDKLAEENLAPAWLQRGSFRPGQAMAVIALPAAAASADLVLPDLALPEVADALEFGTFATFRLKLALGWMFSIQCGLLVVLLSADARITTLARLGSGWAINDILLAAAGILPAFLILPLAKPRRPGNNHSDASPDTESV